MNCFEINTGALAADLSHDDLLALLKDFSWCGGCADCLYAFVVAAQHLSNEELLDVFGSNLLDKAELQTAFDEMVGFKRVLHPDIPRMMQVNKIMPQIKAKFPDSALIKHYVNESLKQYESNLFEDYFNMSMT